MKIVIPMVGIGEAGGIKVLFKLADILVDKGHDVTFIIIEGKDTYEKLTLRRKQEGSIFLYRQYINYFAGQFFSCF